MDGATKIWLDDPNPIFRMGLAASLRDSRFLVVGESAGFVPPPPLDEVDVLVFDLGVHPELAWNLGPLSPAGRGRRRSTRLVGLVPGGDAEVAAGAQCTVLVRSELTPEGFRNCLASVAADAPAPPRPAARAGGRPLGVVRTAGAGGGPGGFVRVALTGAGAKLRRLAQRKGVLFAVVLALAAGAVGPTGRADGLAGGAVAAMRAAEIAGGGVAGPAMPVAEGSKGGAKGTVQPVKETQPVRSEGDAAGGVAIWVNDAEPAASLVIGVDRQGVLETYDLTGRRVQRLDRPEGSVTDVDVRSGFPLRGRPVDLVGAGGRALSFFRLDPAGRKLHDVSARTEWRSGNEFGFCLYRSGVSGRFYAFLTAPGGDVIQFELFDRGGLVERREVRRWPSGRPAQSCVADDETGRLFVGDGSGVWRYDAEPDASPVTRRQVDKVGGDHLAASVGGLALIAQPGRRGYLVASSRGDSSFAVYRRGGDHGWLGRREVVGGAAADGCSASRGIAAVAANLGDAFPAGLFVCQDGRNTPPGPSGRQNFKLVRLDRFLDAGSLPS